ncbi:hypothetical protein, partial [Mycolicibacterium fortuitum]|uniref:hypothetical protein n=1 Tax=Mycolicibacterium fortuitum TaxID=1766 RepID=UPI001041F0FC
MNSAANGAADDIAALIDGLLGSGHVIQDLVNHLQDVGEDATNAAQYWLTVFTDTGQSTATALASFISGAASDAAGAVSDLATIVATTGAGTISTLASQLASLIAFLTSIPASLIDGVPTSLQELVDDVVGGTGNAVSDLVTAINSGISDAAEAVSDIDDMLVAAGQTLAEDFGDFVYNANVAASSAVEQLVDAAEFVGGEITTAAHDFGAAVQSMLTSWVNAWWPGFGGSAATPAHFVTAAENSSAAVNQNSIDIAAIQAQLASGSDGTVGGINVVVPLSGSLPSEFDNEGTVLTSYTAPRYNVAEPPTDEMSVTILNPGTPFLLIVRANDDFSSFVYLRGYQWV